MSKNRRLKGSKPPPVGSRAPRARRDGRSREVVGIIALGSGIFVIAALLSLQVGDGHLMGPFGRSIAATVYAFSGLCSYAVAVAFIFTAIRLLLDREAIVVRNEALGFAIGLLSVATLLHLFGSGYRIDDYGPGGVLGEHFAEVLRAVISTAGTALLAVVGLVVAVVVATPLRMRNVLEWIVRLGMFCWSGIRGAGQGVGRGVMALGRFCGEVVRAILPERDYDQYAEQEAHFVDTDDYDAYEIEEEDPAFVDPPIIDARSGSMEAAPVEAIDADDTVKIKDDELAARLAEARSDEVDAKAKKPKKTTKSKAKKVVKPQIEVIAVEPNEDQDDEADAVGAELPDPVIVESRFKHKDMQEMERVEEEVDSELLDFIPLGDGQYKLPPINLLDYDDTTSQEPDRDELRELAARLTRTLEHYKIKGEVVAIRPGPVVTMFEFAPAPGTRLNKIVNLADDLAMALEALRVRIVAPIPGKAAVGIEVPNKNREMVYLKEILADDSFRNSTFKLPLAMGKDIEGAPSVVDLAKMPHLLVAGTTGSGKSVSVNSMIASLLYNCTPEQVRLIMVDPKMLELSVYEGIPHLLLPVVTDPKKANLALRWAVDEMERRYQLLSDMRVRDIAGYNKKLEKLQAKYEAERLTAAAEQAQRLADQEDDVEITEERQMMLPKIDQPPVKLPYIVIVIDEFADLMMCAPKEVETSVARIAQKARAAGIHLILATQRPSVNVITGLIKANFPSRVAFHVASKVDSRTILDQMGAERLLGAGDMLFSDRGASPKRIHGCYVGEDEICRIVDFLKSQGRPVYNLDIVKPRDEDSDADDAGARKEDLDEMYDRAIAIVQESRSVSISMIQRRLRIGYNRAARIVEAMELEGVVSAPDHTNKREVLLSPAA